MAQITPTPNKINATPVIVSLVGVAALVVIAGIGWPAVRQAAQAKLEAAPQAAAPQTAKVATLTAETYVTAAGAVLPAQSATVMWKTTGNIASVYVRPGDEVQASQPLMSLDPLTAPQAVISAQASLVAAQRALDDLLHPSALAVAQAETTVSQARQALDDLRQPPALNVANARQAVAKAQDGLDKSRKALANTERPDLKYYQDQVKTAQNALTNAQQDTTLTDIGQLSVNLRNAQKQLETATNVYNNAKDAFAKCPACEKVWAYDRMTNWEDAVNLYTDAVNQVQQIQMQIDQAQRGNSLTLSATQDNLDQAQRNLNWALVGPDTTTVGVSQAAVEVAAGALADAQDKLNKLLSPDPADVALAQAKLADAQDKLDHLQNGADPRDLAVAQAQLEAVQATVNGLTLTAPFAGEVLAVNGQAGDIVDASLPAVVLANRQVLRVEVQLDEVDARQVVVGQPVSVTFESLPGLALPGRVTWINENADTVQGLVKYTVRVEMTESDPRVLLGMTADVSILVRRQAGALGVPPRAVQHDAQGEFVNRLKEGAVERVSVISGPAQGDLLVVAGPLQAGDEVQIPAAHVP